MSRFSTGRIFSRAISDPESLSNLRISREFTPQLVAELSKQGGEHMREMYKNFFSIFELEGPNGLYATLLTYINRKGLLPEAVAAINEGDTGEFLLAVIRSLEFALYELYMRGALSRIMLVDEIPELALQDYFKLSASVRSQPEPEPVAAPVAPAPPVDLIDLVVEDWKNLGSAAFKTKYMSNQRNRPLYDRAVREGRL